MSIVAENLKRIRDEVVRTALSCGRSEDSVKILAVSKTFSHSEVNEAVAAGQLLFGENRVQEAETKIPLVHATGVCWHLIGHLQSNKARRATELFDMVETVDSEKLARRLNRICEDKATVLPVLLEVNVGSEDQKAGIHPANLAELVEIVDGLSHLDLEGLMAIPPYSEKPDDSRPYFSSLRRLAESVNRERERPLTELSMGMSADFQVAIQEGSTLVRLGTAIFGIRE